MKKKAKTKKYGKKIPLSQEIRRMYKMLIFVIILLNVVLGGVLLYTGNIQNLKGYTLRELQLKNDQLLEQNKTLETKIIDARTSDALGNNEVIEKMENILEIEKKQSGTITYTQGNLVTALNEN